MFIFALEDQHQKARSDAMAKISAGTELRFEDAEPLWDRKVALHFRSPRGPKGASLGYAPQDVASEILASMREGKLFQATAIHIETRHGLRQMVVAVSEHPLMMDAMAADVDFARRIEQALESAPKEHIYVPRLYSAGVVGEQHYQSAVKRCREGDPVYLVPEPSNKYDARAIVVMGRGQRLGHLPRESWLHRVILDEGNEVSASIKSIEDRGQGFRQVVLNCVVGTAEDLVAAQANEPVEYRATIFVDGPGAAEDKWHRLGRETARLPPLVKGAGFVAILLLLGYCTGGISSSP